MATGPESAGELSVPTTMSPEAQAYFRATYSRANRDAERCPEPDDEAGWVQRDALARAAMQSVNEALKRRYLPKLTEAVLGGVRIVDICPARWRLHDKLIVYTHGGGFVGRTGHHQRNCAGLFVCLHRCGFFAGVGRAECHQPDAWFVHRPRLLPRLDGL